MQPCFGECTMIRNRLVVFVAALALATHASRAQAGIVTAYGVTGAGGNNSTLYTLTINTTTDSVSASNPVSVLVGTTPVSLSAIAVDPVTFTIYGATNSNSANFANSLVQILPNGSASVIGTFGTSSSDYRARSRVLARGNPLRLFENPNAGRRRHHQS